MAPSPPFLVVKTGISFWVEESIQDVTATIQAFNEGCCKDVNCYDVNSIYWPVEKAELISSPTFVRYIFPCRKLPVKLTFGKGSIKEVAEVTEELIEVLRGSSEFNEYLSKSTCHYIAQFKLALSAEELIKLASKVA